MTDLKKQFVLVSGASGDIATMSSLTGRVAAPGRPVGAAVKSVPRRVTAARYGIVPVRLISEPELVDAEIFRGRARNSLRNSPAGSPQPAHCLNRIFSWLVPVLPYCCALRATPVDAI